MGWTRNSSNVITNAPHARCRPSDVAYVLDAYDRVELELSPPHVITLAGHQALGRLSEEFRGLRIDPLGERSSSEEIDMSVEGNAISIVYAPKGTRDRLVRRLLDVLAEPGHLDHGEEGDCPACEAPYSDLCLEPEHAAIQAEMAERERFADRLAASARSLRGGRQMKDLFSEIQKLEDLLPAILHRLPDALRSTYEAQANDAINRLRAAAARVMTKRNRPRAVVKKRPRGR